MRQDKPGAVSHIADLMPGFKQARRILRPGLDIPDHILTAHVAETGSRATIAQEDWAARQLLLREAETIFGSQGRAGGQATVEFIGAVADSRPGLTGTIKDAWERPELYRLTRRQEAFFADAKEVNTRAVQGSKQGYGVDIGIIQALPNIDQSKGALEAYGGSLERAATAGRLKTRFYETAADRMKADPTFKPVTNLDILLAARDQAKASAVGRQVFLDSVGGKTRLEVMEITHPKLAAIMKGLRQRLQSLRATTTRLGGKQAETIDTFLSSPMEANDLDTLLADLNPVIKASAVGKRGPNYGKDLRAMKVQITKVKADIQKFKLAWNVANLHGYKFVQEGVYRYFPVKEADIVVELRKTTSNRFIRSMSDLTAFRLGGDLSPIVGVQTPLGLIAHPLIVGKEWARGIKSGRFKTVFGTQALAEDISKNMDRAKAYAFFTGRPIVAGTPAEFAGGWLSRIPAYRKLNEGMYVGVERQSFNLFNVMSDELVKSGMDVNGAYAAAADHATKVYPSVSPARLGQSQSRATMLRAATTSISFATKPSEVVLDATRGFLKIPLKQSLTPREKLGVKLVLTSFTAVTGTSLATSILAARSDGTSEDEAIKRALDPNDRHSLAITLPGGYTIPIGGPYRGLLKAMWPRKAGKSPVPVPFGGFITWAGSRMNPGVSLVRDLTRNKDFYGNQIIAGEFPVNVLEALLYSTEGLMPLGLSSPVQGVRTEQSARDIAISTAGQVLGTNVTEQTPFQAQNVAVQRWAQTTGASKAPELGGGPILGYTDLTPSQKQAFKLAHPKEVQNIEAEVRWRAGQGQPGYREQVRRLDLSQQAYAQQEADDALFAQRKLDGWGWRDRRATRRAELFARKDELVQGVDFSAKRKTALDAYYAQIDKAKAEFNGVLTAEAWDQVDTWIKAQSPSEQQFIADNTGLGVKTFLEEEYERDMDRLKPYWEVGEEMLAGLTPKNHKLWRTYLDASPTEQKALRVQVSGLIQIRDTLRENMRIQDRTIDGLLVRWYGYTPKHPQQRPKLRRATTPAGPTEAQPITRPKLRRRMGPAPQSEMAPVRGR